MPNRFHVWCLAAAFAAGGATGFAQNSDFKLDVHANDRATAEKIGLPVYPGAEIYQDKDNSSADLGLVLNSFHFDLKAVNYITPDAPDKVLDFTGSHCRGMERCWSACTAKRWARWRKPAAG